MLISYPLFFQLYQDGHREKYILVQVFYFRDILSSNQSLSAEIIEEFIAVYLVHHNFD